MDSVVWLIMYIHHPKRDLYRSIQMNDMILVRGEVGTRFASGAIPHPSNHISLKAVVLPRNLSVEKASADHPDASCPLPSSCY